jgi:hypothetical protein
MMLIFPPHDFLSFPPSLFLCVSTSPFPTSDFPLSIAEPGARCGKQGGSNYIYIPSIPYNDTDTVKWKGNLGKVAPGMEDSEGQCSEATTPYRPYQWYGSTVQALLAVLTVQHHAVGTVEPYQWYRYRQWI